MSNVNSNLNKAKDNKKDEFYTRLEDIENELRHYKKHFKGKVVLCNCDDPRCSNFFRYFTLNFGVLGLKKVIATCYKNQDVDLFTQNTSERAVYQIYEGDKNNNRKVDDEEIEVRYLKGDGDFRSPECLALLEEADIVVTNPPFSLFREYIALLIKYKKKFLVIGHQNAVKYKEIFPLIRDNKIWLGYGFKSGVGYFICERYEDYAKAGEHIPGMIRVSGVHWFTNLEIDKRNDELPLFKKYTPEEYPTYVNFNAIEVGKTANIPYDYDGLMGVPITFMDKYNPEQFEIVGMSLNLADMSIIRKKLGRNDGGPTFYIERDDTLLRLYDRIVIRRKKVK